MKKITIKLTEKELEIIRGWSYYYLFGDKLSEMKILSDEENKTMNKMENYYYDISCGVSMDEYAKELGISRRTLSRKINSGEIKPYIYKSKQGTNQYLFPIYWAFNY